MLQSCRRVWTHLRVDGLGLADVHHSCEEHLVCAFRVRVADAGVAQLVESELPKLVVAGSNPVARSTVLDGHSEAEGK